MKKCKRCNEDKPLDDFYDYAANKDGKACVCKKCKSVIGKLYRKNNPIKCQKYHLKYHRQRKLLRKTIEWTQEKCEILNKNYPQYGLNYCVKLLGLPKYRVKACISEKLKLKRKYNSIKIPNNFRWCSKCRLSKPIKDFSMDGKLFRRQCKHCSKIATKNWSIINKERINENHRRLAKRYRQNPKWRAIQNLRSRLSHVLRGRVKDSHTMNLVGCTKRQLENHLESKFTRGMNWSNYGLKGWHIDHIKPCSSFDLTLPEERIKCFHYSNLQTLWAEDNLSKGDNLIY